MSSTPDQLSFHQDNVPPASELTEQLQQQAETDEHGFKIFRLGVAALQRSEMESDSGYDELFKDVPEPKYTLKSNHGETLNLTGDNTVVIEYPKFPDYNHVHHFRPIDDGKQRNYFVWEQQAPGLYASIKGQGFDIHSLGKPTPEDHAYWMNDQIGASGVRFNQ